MAIYTPRGLKINLQADHAFTLMARLYPQIDAFTILKTTEGIQVIPGLLAFVTGVVCFMIGATPFEVGIYAFLASIIGALITTLGIFVIPGLVRIAVLYSYLSGYGILFLAVIIIGLFSSAGWLGIVAFFIGRISGGIVNTFINFLSMKKAYVTVGYPLSGSERNFFNAYRLYASRLDKSLDLMPTDEEVASGAWKKCLEDFSYKWPEVTRRFMT